MRDAWKDNAGEYTGIDTSVDQLSSLEAAAQAPGQLQGVPGHVGPLLGAFDGFVANKRPTYALEFGGVAA